MAERFTKAATEITNGGWDPRIRMFRVPGEIDTAVVITERFLIYIDAMTTPEQISAVQRVMEHVRAERLVLLINTHADYDHAWGNAAFSSPGTATQAMIIGSIATAARLRSREEHLHLEQRQREEPALGSVRLVPPTISFDSTCVIDGGDLSLHLIPTPGHTHDHISVWLPAIGTVIAGDAAEFPYPFCGEDSNIDVLLASQAKLAALHPATMLVCHGGTTSAELLTWNRAYFARLDHLVRVAIKAGALGRDGIPEAAEEAIGYSFEQSIRDLGADPATIDSFYRRSHSLAIQAAIRRVRNRGKAL